jgi:hypothetical protein
MSPVCPSGSGVGHSSARSGVIRHATAGRVEPFRSCGNRTLLSMPPRPIGHADRQDIVHPYLNASPTDAATQPICLTYLLLRTSGHFLADEKTAQPEGLSGPLNTRMRA